MSFIKSFPLSDCLKMKVATQRPLHGCSITIETKPFKKNQFIIKKKICLTLQEWRRLKEVIPYFYEYHMKLSNEWSKGENFNNFSRQYFDNCTRYYVLSNRLVIFTQSILNSRLHLAQSEGFMTSICYYFKNRDFMLEAGEGIGFTLAELTKLIDVRADIAMHLALEVSSIHQLCLKTQSDVDYAKKMIQDFYDKDVKSDLHFNLILGKKVDLAECTSSLSNVDEEEMQEKTAIMNGKKENLDWRWSMVDSIRNTEEWKEERNRISPELVEVRHYLDSKSRGFLGNSITKPIGWSYMRKLIDDSEESVYHGDGQKLKIRQPQVKQS